MSPREAIEAFAKRELDATSPYTVDGFVEAVLAKLKAEGLFIGPLVATPTMKHAAANADAKFAEGTLSSLFFGSVWDEMREEWQRTEGA